MFTEGDSSLLIVFGNTIQPETTLKVASAARLIREQGIRGIVDLIPAYASLLVNYDPRMISYDRLKLRLENLLRRELRTEETGRRVFEIPVCYGGEYGPDLLNVADHAGLSPQEVIRIHTSRDYLVCMLGFLPGFCYLGGLDERIHTPRLPTPRVRIPAGSVGIGGSQTGIYPLDSPGGWQLMGMTPVLMYDPNRSVPIPVSAGDYIRFTEIGREEYARIRGLDAEKRVPVQVCGGGV